MREHRPDGGEELELATIARDDLLLDALGRGEPAPDGDDVAALLAAWRADVDSDDAEVDRARPAPGTAVVAAGRLPTDSDTRSRPRRSPGPGRPVVRLAAAALAAVALASGLGIGSRHSGPTSPLWSLTKVLYPEQAAERGVAYTIDRARAAATAGRLDEARSLAEQAERELTRVSDPAAAVRLRARLDALLVELAAAAPLPTPRPAPAVPSPTPAAPRGTEPTPGDSTGPAPEPSESSAPDLVPPLPSLPVPPVTDPSASPLLPGLPLPTGDLLG